MKMRILRIADATAGGGGAKEPTPAERIAELEGQVAALLRENRKLKAEQAEASEFEVAVNTRMRPGLSREQAIAAERRQREFDAAKKTAEKSAPKGPAKK